MNTVATLSLLAALGAGAPDRAPGPCDLSATVAAGTDAPVPLRLVLNIPAYRLDVIERDTLAASLTVTVGSPAHRTPIGQYGIDYVEWNPWWHPPPSPWARGERPARPGWSNPVGRVKMHVTGLVFLHGSPVVQSLGTAASHACVRLANDDAMMVARLVHRHASPADIAPLLDSLQRDTSATRRITLTARVPMTIRYDLAEVRGDDLVVYPDIYRLAGRRVPAIRASAMTALARAGRDTATVRADLLRRLLRDARASVATIRLDALVAVATGMP